MTQTMKIDVRAGEFRMTEAIRAHIERRVERALRVTARWVERVAVTVGDVNGDRGGVDKYCRVTVRCRRHGTLSAAAVRADLYLAIDDAVEKAQHAVVRRLGRRPRRSGGASSQRGLHAAVGWGAALARPDDRGVAGGRRRARLERASV